MKLELTELREEILQWCMDNKTGNEHLVILSAGEDNASEIYMRNKILTGDKLGIRTSHIRCNSPKELESMIIDCNDSPNVTGVICQLPLPQGYNEDYFINLIDYKKDVDMLTNTNRANIHLGLTNLLPATASGVMYTIDDIIGLENVSGMDVCLIGRSSLVNLPLQKALMDYNCTVQLCHSKTKDLANKCANSDIIVSAAGRHGLIDLNCIGNKTKLILDVSINRVDGKIKGDVVDKVYELVDTTANPRGLGVLTTAFLFKNLISMTKGEY